MNEFRIIITKEENKIFFFYRHSGILIPDTDIRWFEVDLSIYIDILFQYRGDTECRIEKDGYTFTFDIHGGVRRDDGYIKIIVTSAIEENDTRLYNMSYGDINQSCHVINDVLSSEDTINHILSVIVGHEVSLQHTITYGALSHITLHIFCDIRLLCGYAYFICRKNEKFDMVTMVSTCHALRKSSSKQLNLLPNACCREYNYFSLNTKFMCDIDVVDVVVNTVGVMLNKGYTISKDKVIWLMYSGKAHIY